MESGKNSFWSKVKPVFADSLWTIAALVLMNIVAQFVVYPAWHRVYNDEIYGNIIYVMSLVNVFSVSMGIAANYARMSESAKRETCNGDYNIMMAFCSLLSAVLCFFLIQFSNFEMRTAESVLAAMLSVFTMWRYYADVEYRLVLNYKGYFLYYLVISLGYLVGLWLFSLTMLWPLALLPGEISGLLFLFFTGNIFTSHSFECGTAFLENFHTVALLIVTNILNNAIFNGDRILLQILLGGNAVTIYYLASLTGKTMSLVTTPLNSVIIGYISRYKGKFTRKMIDAFLAITGTGIFAATICAWIGSHILIRMIYPTSYEEVKGYFFMANMAQILYFITNIVTTVLLRIGKTNCQLVINVVYVAAFLVLCIPAAYIHGVSGFAVALLVVNLIRYAIAIGYCYQSVRGGKNI